MTEEELAQDLSSSEFFQLKSHIPNRYYLQKHHTWGDPVVVCMKALPLGLFRETARKLQPLFTSLELTH
ncbi:MAG TPA: hypothetical protein VK211_09145 [Kamptonema sp.]|nr:hypothetical protein [Kamptonema sp.]